MKQPLIIFGAGDIAQLAHYYFKQHPDYDVIAFTVDAAYRTSETFCGLPLVDFEEVAECYPAVSHAMFVALSYSKLNGLRKEKYLACKAAGYSLASYISPNATVLNEGEIGENCFVLEDCTIQPFVTIGNNVTLWSGSHIGHHSCIHDHSFIAPHVSISGGVIIGEQCFLGINATLRDHITIGPRCVIGAGALMLAHAEADGVYLGKAASRRRVPSSRLFDL